jgi:O-antigen/teichoic acid export membrane protein
LLPECSNSVNTPNHEVSELLKPTGVMRSLARNRASLGAVAGGLVAQAMLVISGPATARLLGVAGRGRLALLIIIVSITGQIAALGLPTAVAYATSSSRVPAVQLLQLLSRAWVSLCLIAATVAGTIAFLVSRVDQSSSGWVEALLAGILVVSNMSFALMFGCLQGERRFGSTNWLIIVNASLPAVILFALLVLVHHTSVRVVLGTLLVANATACILSAYLVMARARRPNVKTCVTVRSLARFGLAALPAANAPLETLSLDQAAVGAILTRPQLGLYAVAAAFDNLPSILVSTYGTVALTRITAETDLAARRHLIRRTAVGAAFIAGGASLFAEVIVGWLLPAAFGTSFSPAIPVARVLIVAGFFLSFRRILVIFLQAAGRPGRTAPGEAIALATLALAAVILVPLLGLIGAACALILAALVADAYLLWMLR